MVGRKSKRRNSERRKERSREAARTRRGKESDIFGELSSTIPAPTSIIQQLDKASVLRLAITHLKIRKFSQLVLDTTSPSYLPTLPPDLEIRLDKLYYKSLNGFLLVIDLTGVVVYASENIQEQLGLLQVDLLGQSILEFTHPCDQVELRQALLLPNFLTTSPTTLTNNPLPFSPNDPPTNHLTNQMSKPQVKTPPTVWIDTPTNSKDNSPTTPPLPNHHFFPKRDPFMAPSPSSSPTALTSPSSSSSPLFGSAEVSVSSSRVCSRIPREVFVRLKNIKNCKPRNNSNNHCNKNNVFKVVHCKGFLITCPTHHLSSSNTFVVSTSPSSSPSLHDHRNNNTMSYLVLECDVIKNPLTNNKPHLTFINSCNNNYSSNSKYSIEDSHENSNSLKEHSRCFISHHSMDMKFICCDIKIGELLGYKREAVIGTCWYDYHHVFDSQVISRAFNTLFSKGRVVTGLYRCLCGYGGYAWVNTTATLVVDTDQLSQQQYVACLHDVVTGIIDNKEILSLQQLHASAATPTTPLKIQPSQHIKSQSFSLSEFSHDADDDAKISVAGDVDVRSGSDGALSGDDDGLLSRKKMKLSGEVKVEDIVFDDNNDFIVSAGNEDVCLEDLIEFSKMMNDNDEVDDVSMMIGYDYKQKMKGNNYVDDGDDAEMRKFMRREKKGDERVGLESPNTHFISPTTCTSYGTTINNNIYSTITTTTNTTTTATNIQTKGKAGVRMAQVDCRANSLLYQYPSLLDEQEIELLKLAGDCGGSTGAWHGYKKDGGEIGGGVLSKVGDDYDDDDVVSGEGGCEESIVDANTDWLGGDDDDVKKVSFDVGGDEEGGDCNEAGGADDEVMLSMFTTEKIMQLSKPNCTVSNGSHNDFFAMDQCSNQQRQEAMLTSVVSTTSLDLILKQFEDTGKKMNTDSNSFKDKDEEEEEEEDEARAPYIPFDDLSLVSDHSCNNNKNVNNINNCSSGNTNKKNINNYTKNYNNDTDYNDNILLLKQTVQQQHSRKLYQQNLRFSDDISSIYLNKINNSNAINKNHKNSNDNVLKTITITKNNSITNNNINDVIVNKSCSYYTTSTNNTIFQCEKTLTNHKRQQQLEQQQQELLQQQKSLKNIHLMLHQQLRSKQQLQKLLQLVRQQRFFINNDISLNNSNNLNNNNTKKNNFFSKSYDQSEDFKRDVYATQQQQLQSSQQQPSHKQQQLISLQNFLTFPSSSSSPLLSSISHSSAPSPSSSSSSSSSVLRNLLLKGEDRDYGYRLSDCNNTPSHPSDACM